ncbi:MAG: hypothetical protein Q4P29_06825 [Tissierellia bacterium]|nr:hypothetical protein [Tissierellia bacterium]
MKINIRIKDKQIHVKAKIKWQTDRLKFILADSLNMKKIKSQDGRELEYNYEPKVLEPFLPLFRAYEINSSNAENIEIEYEGKLEGRFLYMDEELIHFSFYNGWYPVIDNYFDYTVEIENFDENYCLLDGTFDSNKKTWQYIAKKSDDTFLDNNIILVNNNFYSIFKNEDVIFYCEKKHADLIEKYFNLYNTIKDFYIQIYEVNRLEKTNFVYLPENENWKGDGYMRKNLVVSSTAPKNIEHQIILMAHEMGHAYGNGADFRSFEDWINETNAEWSALLFLKNYYPKLFKKRIEYHKKQMQNKKLSLKEKGENRSENVHSTGTLIYYDIYKKFGENSVIDLLKIADSLSTKSTKNLLDALIENDRTELFCELKKYL